VLIQSRGAGISSAISGFGGFYRTKRGLEKVVFIATIVLGIAFILNSAALVMIR
jgi:protein translocase SecG subunit